jgi:deleted-in-malignant-brain-tumors protein 1
VVSSSFIATLRLSGRTVAEGIVEAYHKGEWGKICANKWDHSAATMACKNLGYPSAILNYTESDPSNETVWMTSAVECTERESLSDNCLSKGSCSHGLAAVSCDSQNVRLRGGPYAHEGRVEIYVNGQWSSVCDRHWDMNAATVVCRQLGYNSALYSRKGSYVDGPESEHVEITASSCDGTETSLLQCLYIKWKQLECDHEHDAGVACMPLRLTGGVTEAEGKVEVYHNRKWGGICDADWNDMDAHVVCRELGYPYAITNTTSLLSKHDGGTAWLTDVKCTGQEPTLLNCTLSDWQQIDCSDRQAAKVSCWAPNVRLRDGNNTSEGRVEVYHNGVWGTVCDDSWDINDATVVCRQLGYSRATAALTSAYFGNTISPFWMNRVHCSGVETSLQQCTFGGWETAHCSRGGEAGVSCSKISSSSHMTFIVVFGTDRNL